MRGQSSEAAHASLVLRPERAQKPGPVRAEASRTRARGVHSGARAAERSQGVEGLRRIGGGARHHHEAGRIHVRAVPDDGVHACTQTHHNKRGACHQNWERLKSTTFSQCERCGATRAVQANHGPSYAANARLHKKHAAANGKAAAEREYPAAERKLAGVADCGYWYRNGGVVAQNLEAAKCGALCDMCHILDPSSNAANCNRADPAKRTQAAHTTDR